MNIDLDKYITVSQAARLHGTSRATFYQAAHLGVVESLDSGGRLMLLKESVDKWRRRVKEKNHAPLVNDLVVRVSDRMMDDVREMAAKMGVSLTAYCRMAIRKQIEEDQKNG
jgi:excisionase family DNA binding protein